MRAVASTIILLTLCGFAYAEESKPLATQAGEATAPIAELSAQGLAASLPSSWQVQMAW